MLEQNQSKGFNSDLRMAALLNISQVSTMALVFIRYF